MGLSNAGKSTLLNGIIGCEILPAATKECTKKGVLIKHSNSEIPVIRKKRLKHEKIGEEDIYFFENDKDIIGMGLENINRVLNGINGEFTDNAEDYFYEIDIKISFVNNKKISDNLKEKICFIDMPGFGTINAFEKKDVYSKLIKSCDIFLFIVKNLAIKQEENKIMLDNLFKNISEYRGISTEAIIKKRFIYY